MNKYTTKGIILSRTDYGEADRIIKFITPDKGKVTAMAKGVRRPKSKLAGGIELFSVSDLTLLIGRGQIQTLMSSRLAKHYGQIVKDLDRTQAAYEVIKLINKATEEEPEEAYFDLLNQAFQALDDSTINPQVAKLWFDMRLLKLAGHTPDLGSDLNGDKLTAASSYNFHLDAMRFEPKDNKHGAYRTSDIKFLRVSFAATSPLVLQRVEGCAAVAAKLQPLLQSMLQTQFRL